VPGYSITRADGLALKSALGATAAINPASAVPLVANMVSSSSRGPSYSRNSIKPDVAAPGASVSAEVGTGTGTTRVRWHVGRRADGRGFGGAAAEGPPGASPAEVKALLMNTGETNIGINRSACLVPSHRSRASAAVKCAINKAVASKTAAWGKDDEAGSLSFGYDPISKSGKLKKKVVVRNYGASSRSYTITPAFRYADDARAVR